MPSFTPYTAMLPAEQQALWPQLIPFRTCGYVLYGGTAISLRLGHRPSIDFDFFSDQPLQQPRLLQSLPWLAHAQTIQTDPDTWSVLVNAPGMSVSSSLVKVSMFGGIDVGRVGTPDVTADGVLTVASLDDLLAYKVKVVLQRVEAKDYRDVAALLRAGLSLERGLAAAATLFGPSFQPSESLRALTYFQGGDLGTLTQADRTTLHAAASAVNLGAGLPTVPRLAMTLL
jgi:hypothetical protein